MHNKHLYDQIAQGYDQNINPTKQYASFPTLHSLAGDISGKKVLDLACGSGYFTRQLANVHPSKIIGVDISEKMIATAKQEEQQSPLGIEYIQQDVLLLDLKEKFDVITAVYLLDYAQTQEQLVSMLKHIYDHLDDTGIFATITVSPKTKIRDTFIRGWKIVSPIQKAKFSDGDMIHIVSDDHAGPPVTIECFYWSEDTYTACMKEAGFTKIEWKYRLEISPAGMEKYGQAFWDEVQKDTTSVGIRCQK